MGRMAGNIAAAVPLGEPPPIDPPKDWYVLLVQPRRELDTAKRLIDLGIDAYCPVYSQRRICGRKMQERDVCMLPTYLPAKLPAGFSRWGIIQSTKGMRVPFVLSVDVYGARIPIRVPEAAMSQIIAKEAQLQKKPSARPDALTVGRRVDVVNGPFAWFGGLIEDIEKLSTQGRLRVAVEIFGRLTSVELEAADVRAA